MLRWRCGGNWYSIHYAFRYWPFSHIDRGCHLVAFLVVYGIDGGLTICHRIILHENLGEAHRKHVYQLMANELKMSHPLVSGIYMLIQLVISLGLIYMCPDAIVAHWIYFICAVTLLAIAYVLFKKKYYYLHEEYLKTINM